MFCVSRDELQLRKIESVLHYSLIYRTALFFVVDLWWNFFKPGHRLVSENKFQIANGSETSRFLLKTFINDIIPENRRCTELCNSQKNIFLCLRFKNMRNSVCFLYHVVFYIFREFRTYIYHAWDKHSLLHASHVSHTLEQNIFHFTLLVVHYPLVRVACIGKCIWDFSKKK